MKSKVDDLHCALNFSRKIIGIKFVLKKEDFEKVQVILNSKVYQDRTPFIEVLESKGRNRVLNFS